MSNILALQGVRFDTRTALGGCLMNIDGETYDVYVEKDSSNFASPTYTVKRKDNHQELCTFRPWNVFSINSRVMFQIEGVSESGGDGTLIVPVHEMLGDETDDEDENGHSAIAEVASAH